jgi:hypothetical protein
MAAFAINLLTLGIVVMMWRSIQSALGDQEGRIRSLELWSGRREGGAS